MGVTVRSTTNIPRLKQALQKLGRRSIKVGVFGQDNYQYGDDADIVTIARVHEFGVTIKPRTAKYLTIPLIPEAKGKRAKDFPDLFKRGKALCRTKGNGQIEAVFALMDSVTIPERSFLRTGFDQNIDKITDKMELMLGDVINLSINPDFFLDAIGEEFASLIRLQAKNLHDPPNAPATKAVKGSSNPLHDSGQLIGAIRHEVE